MACVSTPKQTATIAGHATQSVLLDVSATTEAVSSIVKLAWITVTESVWTQKRTLLTVESAVNSVLLGKNVSTVLVAWIAKLA
tara:strand:- start:2281 stop:2529 length:249 start_codon:yes stop_codon:yes gene_type:complete